MVCWDLLQKKANIKNIIQNHHVLLHSYSDFLSSHVGKVLKPIMIATSFSSSAGAFGVVKFHDLDDFHHFSSTRHHSSAQLANPAVPDRVSRTLRCFCIPILLFLFSETFAYRMHAIFYRIEVRRVSKPSIGGQFNFFMLVSIRHGIHRKHVGFSRVSKTNSN